MGRNQEEINEIYKLMRKYGVDPYDPNARQKFVELISMSKPTRTEMLKEKIITACSGTLGCLLSVIVFAVIAACFIFMIAAIHNEWLIGAFMLLAFSVGGLIFSIKWTKEANKKFYPIFSMVGMITITIVAVFLIVLKIV